MGKLLLAIAIVANVSTNVFLKKTVGSIGDLRSVAGLRQLIETPSFWAFGVSAATLLGAYILALRTVDLSRAYAFVTMGALVGITIAASFFLGEALTLRKAVGVGLILLGLVLLSPS
jgi:multidrug transporter EmrE-like cation transporter